MTKHVLMMLVAAAITSAFALMGGLQRDSRAPENRSTERTGDDLRQARLSGAQVSLRRIGVARSHAFARTIHSRRPLFCGHFPVRSNRSALAITTSVAPVSAAIASQRLV